MKLNRCWKWVGGTLAALIVICLAAWVVLTALLFTSEPKSAPLSPTSDDLAVQSKLSYQIMRELFRRDPAETATVRLTPEEFQALVRCFDRELRIGKAMTDGRAMPIRYYAPKLGPNRLELRIPRDTGHRWIFGGWIVSDLALAVAKDGDRLEIKVLSCKVGRCRISPEFATRQLAAELEKIRETPDYQKFNRLIQSIAIDDGGNLTIVYRPREAVKLASGR